MARALGVLQRRIHAALAATTNEPPALTTREREVVPGVVELEVAVPRLTPAVR